MLADSSFAERFVEESRLAGAMNHANVVTVHEYFEDGGGALHRHGVPAARLAAPVRRPAVDRPDRRRAGGRAGRAVARRGPRHRPPRSQAREPAGGDRRPGEDRRLRRRAGLQPGRHPGGGHRRRDHDRHPGLHVARAGAGQRTDPGHRPVFARRGGLGAAHRRRCRSRRPTPRSRSSTATSTSRSRRSARSAPDVDEGIARWLEKMLAKRPEDRFQSADEAWVELEDVVLELLGPRWRREARLAVDGTAPRSAITLTPAPFAPLVGGHASRAAGRRGDADPGDGERARRRETTPPPATMAPADAASAQPHDDVPDRPAPPRPTTSARRRSPPTPSVAGWRRSRSWPRWPSPPSPGSSWPSPAPARHGPTKAQLAAAAARVAAAHRQAVATQQANTRLAKIVRTLAVSRSRGLTRLLNDKNPSQQTRDAEAVQKAYVTAARKVSADRPQDDGRGGAGGDADCHRARLRPGGGRRARQQPAALGQRPERHQTR